MIVQLYADSVLHPFQVVKIEFFFLDGVQTSPFKFKKNDSYTVETVLTLSIRGLGPIPLSIPNNFDIIHSLKK